MGGRKARREGADASPAAGSKDDGGAKGRAAGRRRKGGGRRVLSRLFYWSLVLGLWAVIAGVGAIAFVAAPSRMSRTACPFAWRSSAYSRAWFWRQASSEKSTNRSLRVMPRR